MAMASFQLDISIKQLAEWRLFVHPLNLDEKTLLAKISIGLLLNPLALRLQSSLLCV